MADIIIKFLFWVKSTCCICLKPLTAIAPYSIKLIPPKMQTGMVWIKVINGEQNPNIIARIAPAKITLELATLVTEITEEFSP